MCPQWTLNSIAGLKYCTCYTNTCGSYIIHVEFSLCIICSQSLNNHFITAITTVCQCMSLALDENSWYLLLMWLIRCSYSHCVMNYFIVYVIFSSKNCQPFVPVSQLWKFAGFFFFFFVFYHCEVNIFGVCQTKKNILRVNLGSVKHLFTFFWHFIEKNK